MSAPFVRPPIATSDKYRLQPGTRLRSAAIAQTAAATAAQTADPATQSS